MEAVIEEGEGPESQAGEPSGFALSEDQGSPDARSQGPKAHRHPLTPNGGAQAYGRGLFTSSGDGGAPGAGPGGGGVGGGGEAGAPLPSAGAAIKGLALKAFARALVGPPGLWSQPQGAPELRGVAKVFEEVSQACVEGRGRGNEWVEGVEQGRGER